MTYEIDPDDVAELISHLKGLLKAINKQRENKKRFKGVCPYRGYEVHPNIFITPGVSLIVNNNKFKFRGREQWKIVTRFLKSIKEGEDNSKGHFPVPFTTVDYNKCKDECLALIRDFVERQTVSHRERNKRYEAYARFMMEKLK